MNQISSSIFDLTAEEIKSFFVQHQQPSYRAQQFCQWLFEKRCFDISAMSNLGQTAQNLVQKHFNCQLPIIHSRIDTKDGTTKLVLKNNLGLPIETVIMRYSNRTSLCVSCQVGCRLACQFCQTGKLGFFRNLQTSDIISQFAVAQNILHREGRRISHVVFMGMGEPFDNYDAVMRAVNLLTRKTEFGLSTRHVTVSTSGIVPRIYDFARDSSTHLAVSLHAAKDTLRSKLMPINQRYPLSELKQALVDYQKLSKRKITLEYILLKGINSSRADAKALVKFIHGLRVKVNLIPYNPHPGLGYEQPSYEEIKAFQQYLTERSIPAPVRYSRGLEGSAACGQLAAKDVKNLSERPNRRYVQNFLQSPASH